MTTSHGWQAGAAMLVALSCFATSGRAQALRLAFDGQPGDGAGHVTELGDLDQDGAADFAIGAPNELNSDGYPGTVRAYSGRSGALLWEVRGGTNAHAFGQALADAGDVDGDGIRDLLVGDPGDDRLGVDGGGYIVYRGVDGSVYYSGFAGAGAFKGNAVAGIGDVDGDKHDDVAIALVGADAVTVRTLTEWGLLRLDRPAGRPLRP